MTHYVQIHPSEGSPTTYTVHLVVGQQNFCVTPVGYDNEEDAQWMRDRLVCALERIVKERNTIWIESPLQAERTT